MNKEIQEKFLAINFGTGTLFRWRNDLGNEYENATQIVDFILKLRQCTKSNLGFIPFKCCIYDHFTEEENYHLDLLRCFRIIDLFKKNKIQCLLVPPKDGFSVVNYPVFKGLEL